ncbi:N-acetylneuraminate synthase family protein [candidate division KSB1 bacterium]|nr:N-acetylneuraminate synthase family protein [candidate division KSB1 bacterium]
MNTNSRIQIKDKWVGENEPVFIIAEIGINHNGSLEFVKSMIDGAVKAGCDAVKFQKRTPEICVPKDQWNILRDTPWGRITYLEYRHKVELGLADYREIDNYCKAKGIFWFASCWDKPSIEFIEQFDPPLIKAPSACLTDLMLIKEMKKNGHAVMISTGMSTLEEIKKAIDVVGEDNLLLAHSTSNYPCVDEELNLRVIQTLKANFPHTIVGYSGHEIGLPTTVAAVALGARFVERHITLERAMWGTDQAASIEIHGLEILVRHIRSVEKALGDGIKRVYESEKVAMRKLRRFSMA